MAYARYVISNQGSIASGQEHLEALLPIAARKLQLGQHETPQHQDTSTLDSLSRTATRRQLLGSERRLLFVITNPPRMGLQLRAHQRQTGADIAPQMPASRIDQIRGNRRTQIEHQTRLSGGMIGAQHRQPAIQPKSPGL